MRCLRRWRVFIAYNAFVLLDLYKLSENKQNAVIRPKNAVKTHLFICVR